MEFYTHFAIFPGENEFDQLGRIFKLCGTPTENNWPGAKDLPWHGLLKYPASERLLAKEFKHSSYNLTEQFVDLVDRLLTLDPSARLSATEALSHPYFLQESPYACEPYE